MHTHTITDPTIITSSLPLSYTMQLGNLETLPCVASSQAGADLQFSWMKDGSSLDVSGRLQYDDPGNTGSIILTEPQTSDAGEYICTVMTSYNGEPAPVVQSDPSTVTVSGKRSAELSGDECV